MKKARTRRLRNYLLTGLLVWLPVAVTCYVMWWGFKTVDSVLGNTIADFTGVRIPGVGLVTTLLIILLTGIFAAHYIGKWLIGIGEKMVVQIPLVRSIYLTVKQIVDAFLHGANVAFKQVVLIEYPRKGIYSIGFITADSDVEIREKTAKDVVGVMLPTTPNPTSGFLLFVPKEELIYLDLSVEDGLKLVVSGGIVSPANKPKEARNNKNVEGSDGGESDGQEHH